MPMALRWTSADLALLPDDGKRYEIIDGALYVSRPPHWPYQYTCGMIFSVFNTWSRHTQAGRPNLAPGVIFADDNDVVPDVVWISQARRAAALGPDGHLHAAPELAVEVLSPGSANERRDREVKRKLSSRRGVLEYWLVDWRTQQGEVYQQQDGALCQVVTLSAAATLTSPRLPGFACPVATLFETTP